MKDIVELVPIHKWPICPISALREKFNPRNINHMPADKFSARLDLDQICLFLDEHELMGGLRQAPRVLASFVETIL